MYFLLYFRIYSKINDNIIYILYYYCLCQYFSKNFVIFCFLILADYHTNVYMLKKS